MSSSIPPSNDQTPSTENPVAAESAETAQTQGAPKPQLTKSQSDRAKQTGKAMLYSVLATLVIVLAFMALNPRGEHDYDPGVDVAKTAQELDGTAEFTPASPEVPEDWRANYARWHTGASDDIPYWEAGYLTDDEQFFGFAQTAHANTLWINEQIKEGEPDGTVQVAGTEFDMYVDEQDHRYMVGNIDDPAADEPVTLITHGSMSEKRLTSLTEDIIAQTTQQN